MARFSPRPTATLAAVLACAAATTFLIAIIVEGHVDLPRALPFLALWTAAPYIAVLATRAALRAVAMTIVALALVAELTSYMSMGGGFVYALVCGPLLLISLVVAGRRMG